MKIAIGSDFHFDFHNLDKQRIWDTIDSWEFDSDTDVIVIAGDLQKGAKRVVQVLKVIHQASGCIPIVYVPGNHEYYGSTFFWETMRFNKRIEECRESDIHILLNHKIKINDVTFCGCMGAIDGSWEHINQWTHGRVNDFSCIRDYHNHEKIGRAQFDRMRKFLKEYENCVMVTHTLPSPRCIDPKRNGDILNPCFANDWSELIYVHEPKVWICGHSHDGVNMMIYNTHIVSNPCGYPHESKNWEWRYVEV